MVKASFQLVSLALLSLSCIPFRRMVGAQAPNEQYKCTHDADCKDKCDADHYKENCLELPSKCFNGLCACPFGPEHSVVRKISISQCAADSDCTKFCPIECTIKTCTEGKCSCGCHG